MAKRIQQRRMIAVLVETDNSWGREVIQGIASYAKQCAPNWDLLIDPRDRQGRLHLPAGWKGDGVIARFSSKTLVNQVRKTKVPTVDVDTFMLNQKWMGHVITDDDERIRLVLEHLKERGFDKLAFYAPPSRSYSGERERALRKAASSISFDYVTYKPGYPANKKIGWSDRQQYVSKWLKSLPRPIGVFAADERCGRQLAEICHWEGIRVPEDIAIICGRTDELMCNVTEPALTSVVLASDRLGYEASEILQSMIQGRKPPAKPRLIKPVSVIPRQSTDILAIDNTLLADAIRYIRVHATQGASVEDVLEQVPISRRTLEMQFRSLLGRTPAEEIRRVRLTRAKLLLAQTDLSIGEVAHACGFSGAARLSVSIRQAIGVTPREYRRSSRGQ